MTAIKCKQEYKTLLDFSDTKRVSKNLVKQQLRNAELQSYRNDGRSMIHITHDIVVGMYKIRLSLHNDMHAQKSKLKEYGNFSLSIMELTNSGEKYGSVYVSLPPWDKLFKTQSWYYNSNLRINDLADAVVYCKRLSKLKAFL